MRIAFFHNLPPGGAKKVVFEQIKYLSHRGHKIDLYQLNPSDNFFPFEKFTSKIYGYPFSLYTGLLSVFSRIGKDYKNFFILSNLHRKIANDIDTEKYDVCFVHPDKYTQSPFLLRYLKTKNIYYCHEWLRIVYEKEFAFEENVGLFKKSYEGLTRQIRKSIDKKNTLAADNIVVNSKFTSQNVKKAYKRNASVIYPGVDIRLFKPINNSKKEYDVLFVGDKTAEEGFDFLSEIEKNLREKVVIKTISRKTEGFSMTDDELVQEYNKTKIVICLSVNEPFGLVPLEAMACGIPVVAVNEGGYKETVKDGQTGYLLPRDAKIIAKKIEFLILHSELRTKMGENARKSAIENWTWEKTLPSLHKLGFSL